MSVKYLKYFIVVVWVFLSSCNNLIDDDHLSIGRIDVRYDLLMPGAIILMYDFDMMTNKRSALELKKIEHSVYYRGNLLSKLDKSVEGKVIFNQHYNDKSHLVIPLKSLNGGYYKKMSHKNGLEFKIITKIKGDRLGVMLLSEHKIGINLKWHEITFDNSKYLARLSSRNAEIRSIMQYLF